VRMDERELEKELVRKKRPRFTAPQSKDGRLSGFPGMPFDAEQYILFLLLEDARLFDMMNEILDHSELEPLSAEDFSQPRHRELFGQMWQRIEQNAEPLGLADLDDEGLAWEGLAQEFEGFVAYTASLPDADLTLAARRCALQLRRTRLERRMVELRYLSEDAQANSDAESMRRWMGLITRYGRERRQVDEALSRVTVLGYSREAPSPSA
jgi:replicative DNA helicase